MPKLVKTPSPPPERLLGVERRSPQRFQYSPKEVSELKKIGRGVALYIAKSGKSAEKFAYELGLGKGHLSRIIRGEADIKYCTLRTIAKGLGFKDVASFLSQVV